MSLPASLPNLTPKEAAADALYRLLESYDTGDVALFESSLTPDVTLTLAGRVMAGRDAIKADSWDRVSKLETLHTTSNVRVRLLDAGARTAKLTANAVSYHYRPGEGNVPGAPRFVSGAMYSVECVRSEEEGEAGGEGVMWRIKSCDLRLVFTEGDSAVMRG